METREQTEGDAGFLGPFNAPVHWRNGAIAGFLAALAMTLFIVLGDVVVLRDAIAGLYTLEGSLLVGVVTHLVLGTVSARSSPSCWPTPGCTG